jgi:hypothetical protein
MAPHSGCPPEISPLARAQVENLGCTEPGEHGLELTHWSVQTLQTVAIHMSIAAKMVLDTAQLLRVDREESRWNRSQYLDYRPLAA